MNRLRNKIVLVTGALSGIGLAFARLAAAEGAEAVLLTDLNSAKPTDVLLSSGNQCIYEKLDIREEKDWQLVMNFLAKKYGRLDVLVNNAAITGTGLSDRALGLDNTSLNSWREVFQTNLEGIFLGCKTAMELMSQSAGASIVNVGSRSGTTGRHDRIAYSTSKAALLNLTRSVAMHTMARSYNIRCNLVVPSTILTPLWDKAGSNHGAASHELIKKISKKIPMRRFGQPEEVANAILFLASDEASYITGTSLLVDGGATAEDLLRCE